MIKLSIKTVPVILMAALASGCASEFMKGTPAYSGKLVYGIAKSGERVRWNDPKAEKIEEADMSKNLNRLDADRVNVWPIAYYNFPVTSVFWPFAEINDKGWAARPFIMADNYNKDYYYMMWLGNIDNKNESSYFIPAYYKSKDSFVSLPCIRTKETLAIMPPLFIMGNRDKAPIYNVLLPFCRYSSSTGSSYVFPLYLNLKPDNLFLSMLGGWSDTSMFIAPPLFAMTDRNTQPAYHIMFPLGKYDTATGTSYALPLYYKSKDLCVLPLGGWNDRNMAIVPPLFIMTDRDENPSYHYLFPLGNYDTEDKSSYFIPLYYSDKRSFYSIPFGWNKDEFFYAFGPLFWVNTEDENAYNIMWPLVRTCPARSEYRFQPLFDYDPCGNGYDLMYLLFFGNVWKNCSSSGSLFFPLYKYKTDGNSNLTTLLTPLFGFFDDDFYVMPPLYVSERHKEVDPKYRYSEFNEEHDLAYTDHSIFFPFGKLRVIDEPTERIPEYQGHAFMFYGHYEDDLDNTRWLMWPFYYYCEDYYLRDTRTPKEWKDKKSKPKIKKEFKDETVMSLPFYYHKRKPDSSYSNFFGFAGTIRENILDTERNSTYVLPFYLDMWDKAHDDYRYGGPDIREYSLNYKYFFPFVVTTEYPEKDESGLTVLPFFYFYSRTPEEISNSSFFWIFARYEDLKEKSVLSEAMWFLFYYKDQQKTATEEAFTSFRVFGKLYHREKTDDGVNVDVFPFIKYSERNKKKNERGFSFAWRLFNIKNDDDGLKRLDIFFIPCFNKTPAPQNGNNTTDSYKEL